jgi:phage head maturation protease
MNVAARIARRDIVGSSFTFATLDPDDEQWLLERTKKMPLRKVYRAKLYDVSPVTWPAYAATTANARARK